MKRRHHAPHAPTLNDAAKVVDKTNSPNAMDNLYCPISAQWVRHLSFKSMKRRQHAQVDDAAKVVDMTNSLSAKFTAWTIYILSFLGTLGDTLVCQVTRAALTIYRISTTSPLVMSTSSMMPSNSAIVGSGAMGGTSGHQKCLLPLATPPCNADTHHHFNLNSKASASPLFK
jgi:hypothetical protein